MASPETSRTRLTPSADDPQYIHEAARNGWVIYRTVDDAGRTYRISDREHPVVWMTVQSEPDTPDCVSAWLTVRTTSWHFEGERSDLHDTISTLVALAVRLEGQVSTAIFVIQNVFTGIPTEIYAHAISVMRPSLTGVTLGSQTEATINNVLRGMWFGTRIAESIILPERMGEEEIDNEFGEGWARDIAVHLGETFDIDVHNCNARTVPQWRWFRSMSSNTSVFDVGDIAGRLRDALVSLGPEFHDGPTRRIYRFGKDSIFHAVMHDRRLRAMALLEEVEGKGGEPLIVPIEDRFIVVGERTVISMGDECGPSSVTQEREEIVARQARERDLFFTPSAFKWVEKVADDRFEQLARELLQREPGIRWVRLVGATDEADGGRDLEAEWLLPDPNAPTNVNPVPHRVRRVLIQCKAYQRHVGIDRVINIRDTVEHFGASGYLLVVSSGVSTQLFDRLKALRLRGDLWVDWWTRREIEDKLRLHPDLVARYSDIVQ